MESNEEGNLYEAVTKISGRNILASLYELSTDCVILLPIKTLGTYKSNFVFMTSQAFNNLEIISMCTGYKFFSYLIDNYNPISNQVIYQHIE